MCYNTIRYNIHLSVQSYRDFHGDLFPETAAAESNVSPSSWLQGIDTQLTRISLDPTEKQLIQVR